MIQIIQCSVCGEVIGTLQKSEITETDVQEYQEMVTCSRGHQSISMIAQNEDQEPDESV
jgi:hypothetical protein